MAPPGPTLAQAVFDAMFLDMDINLREMGVGDLSVGKRNRAMWEAFHGRTAAYAAAWDNSSALRNPYLATFGVERTLPKDHRRPCGGWLAHKLLALPRTGHQEYTKG